MDQGKRLNDSPLNSPIPLKRKINSSADYYISEGIKAISLKQLDTADSIASTSGYFHPAFSYQLLDKKESIYGYRDLKIEILLTRTCLHPYVKMEFSEKLENADDLKAYFDKLFNGGYSTTMEEYQSKIKEDDQYVPSGLATYKFDNFEVHKFQAYTIKDISANLQSVMMLFIDGLSFIDLDPYWHYYLLYKVTGEKEYTLVGYATTYESHQQVNKYRVRISQMLILPNFQRQGLGGQLLQRIYEDLRKDEGCFEITVEEPSDEFLAMRDLCNAKMLLESKPFECFKNFASDQEITAANFKNFHLTKEDIETVCREFKLVRVEAERCFEILLYSRLDHSDDEALRLFRIAVKKRLFSMHKESLLPNERMSKIAAKEIPMPIIRFEGMLEEDDESYEEIGDLPIEDRKIILEQFYSECSAWYKKLEPKIKGFF